MATYIEMPKLSDTMTEGTLVKWLKKEGDKVEAGEPVAEVETDKATMEMDAPDDGILHKILVTPGTKAALGSRLALVLRKGETAPADGAPLPDSPRSASAKADTISEQPSSQSAPVEKPRSTSASAAATGQRLKISPLARKIAQAKGLEISTVQGSGPGGRIVARDLDKASDMGAASTGSAKSSGSLVTTPIPAAPAGTGDQRIPLSGMRRVIAERLLTSKTTIPHFYLQIEVDAAPLMKFRADANSASEAAGGAKLTINDFLLKAVVAAAIRVPAVNASFAGDAIIQYGSVQLSVAVAVDEGLVTPVIRDAQKKTLREISEAVKDLATRARSKKLKPEEYQGGTITVSNLGSYGIESFSAIINPPQALIISVGAIVKKPVVNAKNEIVVGQRLALGLSADHRVVDGAVGAAYLAELRQLVENPALMLL